MHDAVDESKNEGVLVRGNKSMAGMRQGGFDVRYDYCPIRDALQRASPTMILRIVRQ